MMLIPCHLRRSAIEGIGVFTDAAVPAGALVWRFDPMFDLIVPATALEEAPEPVRAFWARYAYELVDRPGFMALDGDDGRFMNHADDPNLDLSRPGRGVAARAIGAGEELTCDYRLLATRPFEMERPRNDV